MIEDVRGSIDYDVSGAGPTIVLVPGSCSTAAAWRPVIASWKNQLRCVATSLPGYGGTAERRPAGDASIAYAAEAVESVVRKAGGQVHLVGHSFGGLVALAVALRKRVPLASLAILEPPAIELLWEKGEHQHYRAFGRMTEAYIAAFRSGNAEAIATMIDFYGGAGTFASWPPQVRAYAVATTSVNITDWTSAYGFSLSAELLSAIDIPTLVVTGETSHPAMQRICTLISECMNGATLATVKGAAHFMIATHAGEVGRLLAQHAHGAKVIGVARAKIAAFSRENGKCHGGPEATDFHPVPAPTRDTALMKSNQRRQQ